jgi:hypothetical protein
MTAGIVHEKIDGFVLWWYPSAVERSCPHISSNMAHYFQHVRGVTANVFFEFIIFL